MLVPYKAGDDETDYTLKPELEANNQPESAVHNQQNQDEQKKVEKRTDDDLETKEEEEKMEPCTTSDELNEEEEKKETKKFIDIFKRDILQKGLICCIKSVSSKKYLDGRSVASDPLMTTRNPISDNFLNWEIIVTNNDDAYALKSRSSQRYLDGRGGESNPLLTARDPMNDTYLQWRFVKTNNDKIALKSVSSGYYLDGRGGQSNPLMTNRDPMDDIYLQWEFEWIQTSTTINGNWAAETCVVEYIDYLKPGDIYAIRSVTSHRYLNGSNEMNPTLTDGNPIGNTFLNWMLQKTNNGFALKSISSQKYLDGRGGEFNPLMTKRDPMNDTFLQWTFEAIVGRPYIGIKSVSSGKYLDGRDENETDPLMSECNPLNDNKLQWEFVRIEIYPKNADKGTVCAIKSVSSQRYLNGRKGETYLLMSQGNPLDELILQWALKKTNNGFALKSISSEKYVDGRGGQEDPCMTARDPKFDSFLQWKFIKTNDGPNRVAIKSVSSKRYLDGRTYEKEPLMTDRDPINDRFLQWEFEWINNLYPTTKKMQNIVAPKQIITDITQLEEGDIFAIRCVSSSEYLNGYRSDIDGYISMTDGNPVDDKDLKWTLIKTDQDQCFAIQAVASNLYLSGADGGSLVNENGDIGEHTQWRFENVDGAILLKNITNKQYLDAGTDKSKAVISKRREMDHKCIDLQWEFEKLDFFPITALKPGRIYAIKSISTGRYLDRGETNDWEKAFLLMTDGHPVGDKRLNWKLIETNRGYALQSVSAQDYLSAPREYGFVSMLNRDALYSPDHDENFYLQWTFKKTYNNFFAVESNGSFLAVESNRLVTTEHPLVTSEWKFEEYMQWKFEEIISLKCMLEQKCDCKKLLELKKKQENGGESKRESTIFDRVAGYGGVAVHGTGKSQKNYLAVDSRNVEEIDIEDDQNDEKQEQTQLLTKNSAENNQNNKNQDDLNVIADDDGNNEGSINVVEGENNDKKKQRLFTKEKKKSKEGKLMKKQTSGDQKRTSYSKNEYANKCYSCFCTIIEGNCVIEDHWSCDEEYCYRLNGIDHIQICQLCMYQMAKLSVSKAEIGKVIGNTPHPSPSNPYMIPATLRLIKLNNIQGMTIDTNTNNMPYKDVKATWMSYAVEEDRTCFIDVVIKHVQIDEKLENGNAECTIKMMVTLYWLFSEQDYESYAECKDKKKWRTKKDDDGFIPIFRFKHVVEGDNPEQGESGVKRIQSCFGRKYLSSMNKDIDLVYNGWGFVGYVQYYCEVKVLEPFELENFPFDCQDVPIFIVPENFGRIAPAYLGNNKPFIRVVGEATYLGIWSINSTIIEFNAFKYQASETDDSGDVRIMLKLKRDWFPYLLQYVFLISCVSILSLTAYALSNDDKPDRVGLVLGLILTLIFIEMPRTTAVTFLDYYYYISFLYLVCVAVHNAVGDTGIVDLFKNDNHLWILNDSNNLWSIIFVCIFCIYHIIFIIVAAFKSAKENRKLSMTSKRIHDIVEREHFQLGALSSDEYNCSDTKITELDGRYDTFVDAYNTTELTKDNKVPSSIKIQKSFSFSTRDGCKMCLGFFFLILTFISVFCVPIIASIMQFILITSGSCFYIDTNTPISNINGTIGLFVLSVVQCILMILFTSMVMNWCCFKRIYDLNFPSALVVFTVFLISICCYIMAIHSFAFWFNDTNIECDAGSVEILIRWLFGAWLILYTLTYILMLVIFEIFVQGDRSHSYDDNIACCLWKCNPSFTIFYESGLVFTTIIIQIPTAVIQLILIWDPTAKCTANYVNINAAECIALLLLSYLFIFLRIATHFIDADDNPIPNAFYMLFYQIIQILAIHGFSYWFIANCDIIYDQQHHGVLAKYISVLFAIWISYDFVINNICCFVTKMYNGLIQYVDHDNSVHWYDHDLEWCLVLFTTFILLFIQTPTALLQLITAWSSDLDSIISGCLVFNGIVILCCVWVSIFIYHIRIVPEANVIYGYMVYILWIPISECFILTINSFIMLSSNNFIWYLQIICIAFYSVVFLALIVYKFIESKMVQRIALLILLTAFVIQISALLIQLYLLQNRRCLFNGDMKYNNAEAIALLILTMIQFAPLNTEWIVYMLPVHIVQFALIIHSLSFWLQDGVDCNDNGTPTHLIGLLSTCIAIYPLSCCGASVLYIQTQLAIFSYI